MSSNIELNNEPAKQYISSLNVRLGVQFRSKAEIKSDEKRLLINEFIKQAVINYIKIS